MTCIVGLIGDGGVYLGADSAGANYDWNLMTRADEKVFINEGFVFGFTSSFRMGQLLQYCFTPPRYHPADNLFKYMVSDFTEAVRQCFKDRGYTEISNNKEQGGTFLVGYRGRLFRIEGDFQVAESINPYDAVGCGADLALGSVFTQLRAGVRPSGEVVSVALAAAEQHCSGVGGPFKVLFLPNEPA